MALDSGFPAGMTEFLALAEASLANQVIFCRLPLLSDWCLLCAAPSFSC